MFDISSQYSFPCSSTTTCPILIYDCNPPYDFYPKQFNFDLAAANSYSLYVPTVKDCIGRQLSIYSQTVTNVNNAAITDPRDSSIFASILSVVSGVGTFTYSFTAPMPPYFDLTGSRIIRYKAKLGALYDKPIFTRFNFINTDKTQIRQPSDETDPPCSYGKIYPFLLGRDFDVNMTSFFLDQYGNLLFSGYGIKIPYGEQNSV